MLTSNLESKVLEVRDSCTHIPVLAIRMLAKNGIQNYYIHERSGYPKDGSCIALVKLNDCDGNCDPYAWRDSRTMGHAHHYIYDHFDELSDGDVVDVEFILGEKPTKKVSERLTIQNQPHSELFQQIAFLVKPPTSPLLSEDEEESL